MKIIILGANQVSQTLAETLSKEDNDVIVISSNTERLYEMRNRFDIQTIVGLGSYPDILEKAGAQDTDMLIAVSDIDEVNMLACQVAYSLFHIPIKIARIRQANYLTHQELYCNENLPVDVIISPEQLVTDHIKRLIECPGAMQVLDFAKGKVKLVGVQPYYGGRFIGKTFKALQQYTNKMTVSFVALFRGKQMIALNDDTLIEAGDEIFFIAKPGDIKLLISLFRRKGHDNKNIMIAGGGHIGARLAKDLEMKYQVKIFEFDINRAQYLSTELDKTIVFHGDGADKDLLVSENIENVDVFCALTNDDEANIMSALQAKRLGADQVMSLVTKSAYVDIIDQDSIDFVISPQNTTISSILAYLRQGDIVTAHSLRRGSAEAIEIIAHGDEKTSRVVSRTLKSLDLPLGVMISAIIRKDILIKINEDTTVMEQDHVIMFVTDTKKIKEVEKLFQVKVNFI